METGILICFFSALVIGLIAFPFLIRYFKKIEYGDAINFRTIHKKFTPTSGGLLIIPVAVLVFLVTMLLSDTAVSPALSSALILVALVGFIDDVFKINASKKILGLTIPIMLLLVATDLRIHHLNGMFGIGEIPPVVGFVLSYLAILFITNSFNLLDGSDGLMGSLALSIFLCFGGYFFLAGQLPLALLAFSISGATLAFLRYNWNPAKIFMGDTGSLTIGFAIAVFGIYFINHNLTLEAGNQYKFDSPYLVFFSIIFIPIFDTFRVMSIRLLEGRSPFSPDKNHVHHLMIDLNVSRKSLPIYFVLTTLLIATSFAYLDHLNENLLMLVLAGSMGTMGIVMDQLKKGISAQEKPSKQLARRNGILLKKRAFTKSETSKNIELSLEDNVRNPA